MVAGGILGLAVVAAGGILVLGTASSVPSAPAGTSAADEPATAGPASPPHIDEPASADEGANAAPTDESADATPTGETGEESAHEAPGEVPDAPEGDDEGDEPIDLSSLDPVLQDQDVDESAHLQQVRAALTAFQVDRAAELAESFVEQAPRSGWGRVALAWTLAERGRWWDAYQAYDEALALDPALHEGHLHQGRLEAVRANAKADLLPGEALSGAQWRPFLGGHWERGEETGEVVGRLRGLIDRGLCGLLWHETPTASDYTLQVELALDLPRAGSVGAGLAVGLPDARQGLFVMLSAASQRDNAGNPEAQAFREQHGGWPRWLTYELLSGDTAQRLHVQVLALPDTGWVQLRVRATASTVTIELGDGVRIGPLTGQPRGRVGLIKSGDGAARYRNFRLTPG